MREVPLRRPLGKDGRKFVLQGAAQHELQDRPAPALLFGDGEHELGQPDVEQRVAELERGLGAGALAAFEEKTVKATGQRSHEILDREQAAARPLRFHRRIDRQSQP